MKTRMTYLFLMLAMFASFTGCKKDDGPPPTGVNIITELSAVPGDEITFSGIFQDEFGLTEISIVYVDWDLNKTIDLPDNPLSYNLNYTFMVPVDAVFDFSIFRTATA